MGQLFTHSLAILFLVTVTAVIERTLGYKIEHLFRTSSIIDDLALVVGIVATYGMLIVGIRMFQFFASQLAGLRGFYIQMFEVENRFFVSFFRVYHSIWRKEANILGRCYDYSLLEKHFKHYGTWSSRDLVVKSDKLISFYHGTHSGEPSFGLSSM